jgi:Subtilisin inhibitor-like
VRILLALMALLALLTACASPSGDAGAGSTPTSSDSADAAAGGGIQQADNDLQVELDRGDGTEPESWTLTCVGFVEGSHPDAEAACEHLKALDDPFAPLPADVACTEQFGGPQTARVLGRWNGQPVDLELSRTDGCRISQWDALGPLLPGPAG